MVTCDYQTCCPFCGTFHGRASADTFKEPADGDLAMRFVLRRMVRIRSGIVVDPLPMMPMTPSTRNSGNAPTCGKHGWPHAGNARNDPKTRLRCLRSACRSSTAKS